MIGRRPSCRDGIHSERAYLVFGQTGIGGLLPLFVMIVAAWFLLVRPQQQRAKQQAEMLSQLQPGSEIVTIGGIFGTVVEVGDERVRIAVVDGSELEIARQAVRTVTAPADETPELDEVDGSRDSDPPIADEDEGSR